MMTRVAGALALAALFACGRNDVSNDTASARSVEFVAAPAGSEAVEAIVTREMARATSDGRQLLIYVGAPWCEPCNHFHAAAERGKLDARLPKLRLLEFDRDKDEARLEAAQCLSPLIPLFAKPTPDGRCDQSRRVAGGIKGEGTVAFIAARLDKMLAM
jgi:hypothetical protein